MYAQSFRGLFLALLIGIRSVILTNIFDRREEIGTLRALGFPRGTVRMLFFGESLVSLFLGYLLGAGAIAVIGAIFEARIVAKERELEELLDGFAGLTPKLKDRANRRGDALQEGIDADRRSLLPDAEVAGPEDRAVGVQRRHALLEQADDKHPAIGFDKFHISPGALIRPYRRDCSRGEGQ